MQLYRDEFRMLKSHRIRGEAGRGRDAPSHLGVQPKGRDHMLGRTGTDGDHRTTIALSDVSSFFKDPRNYLGGEMHFGKPQCAKH